MDPRSSISFGTALIVVGALLGTALGGSTAAVRTGSCDAFATVHVGGRVADDRLDEISGITASALGPDVLWAEEDSGNDAAIYALRTNGDRIASVDVAGATNVDWEDLARADGRLWIGDIGDNEQVRSSIRVYWVDEPDGTGVSSVRANVLTLRYPDGPHDAEGMVVDGDRLFVFEKQAIRARSRIYVADVGGLGASAERQLEPFGSVDQRLITAADVSSAGIVLAGYTGARFYPWAGDVGPTLRRSPCPVFLIGSEAVAFSSDGARIFSVPEGAGASISYAGPPLG